MYKGILLGPSGVGKTSIFYRLKKQIFSEDNKAVTTGFDQFPFSVWHENKKITLNIWDTGGMERHHTVTHSYYKRINVAFLVFSTDDDKSLKTLVNWAKEAQYYEPEVMLVIIGNKIDLNFERREEDVKNLSHHLETEQVFWVSAKTGENVLKAFSSIAIKLNSFHRNPSPEPKIQLHSTSKSKDQTCNC